MHVMTIHQGRKPCKTCKGTVTFQSKEELHQHKMEVHGSATVNGGAATGGGGSTKPLSRSASSPPAPAMIHKCATCNFSTEQKDVLENHINTIHQSHHNFQKPSSSAAAVAVPNSLFTCIQCGWNFNSQYYLNIHAQQVHGTCMNQDAMQKSTLTQNGGYVGGSTNPTTTTVYVLPPPAPACPSAAPQLNQQNYEVKFPDTTINHHKDIIQEVMDHDIFKGLQDDLLVGVGGPTYGTTATQPYRVLQPTAVMVESHQPSATNVESPPNVYMNLQDLSVGGGNIGGMHNVPSGTSSIQPLHNSNSTSTDVHGSATNYDTLGSNVGSMNFCDMKSVGITY